MILLFEFLFFVSKGCGKKVVPVGVPWGPVVCLGVFETGIARTRIIINNWKEV